jgi:hypothetical protein
LQAVIDNNWKIVRAPGFGQCDKQPPYDTWKNLTSSNTTFLFDLSTDYHELHDLSKTEPAQFKRMSGLLDKVRDPALSQHTLTAAGPGE